MLKVHVHTTKLFWPATCHHGLATSVGRRCVDADDVHTLPYACAVLLIGGLVCLSVCLSVCYHVFSRYAQQDGQKAIPTGSVPHWLYFKNGVFGKNAAFESYGVKTK